jgi:type 1 glutamine amidotransferase
VRVKTLVSSSIPVAVILGLFVAGSLSAAEAATVPRPDSGPLVVLLIGEDEYRTAETLPEFARRDLEPSGFKVEVVQDSVGDKGNFAKLLEVLPKADALLISVRRRALPKAQLEAIRAHLEAGKPLIGIRTASHAFAPRDADRERLVVKSGRGEWPQFDPEVFGGNYHGHHGVGPPVTFKTAAGSQFHPILDGVALAGYSSAGSLYRVSPLTPAAVPLLLGAIPGKPEEPVAWTHTYGPKQARVFYTSLGHPDDFAQPAFRRLLLNATAWAVNRAMAAAPPQPGPRP